MADLTGVLTRREYTALVNVIEHASNGVARVTMQRMLGCIASYRVICHHLAPLLHDAIAATDDAQHKAHLQSLLDDLKRGES